MTMNRKLFFTIFLLSVFVLCAGLALAKKDPELKYCKDKCKAQRQYGEEQQEQCVKKCEEYYKEKQEREKQRGEEEWGGSRENQNPDDVEPEKHLRRCRQQCERQEGEQRMLCRLKCWEKYKREKEGEGELNKPRKESEEEEEQQQEEDENPYVFEPHHFISRVRTEHGKAFVLPKFTQRSKLLRGLENYRLGILVANPETFVTPCHLDADEVFFVSWGRGTITIIHDNNRESINVKCGDIVMMRAGTPFYIVNTEDKEKLYIVKFVRPVNNPDQYGAFVGAGGKNPESYLSAFSWEILEAAFKTPRDTLERLLSKQDQGPIMKASKEQIRALSQSEGSPTIWPFAGESRDSFNLFKKGPSKSNSYGQLFEADSNDFRPLEDLDVMVSYANISKGSMVAPFYNSRATKVAIVVSGEGYIEMACPHVSGSSEQRGSKMSHRGKGSATYHKISSPIETDTVYIVPAGHPVVTVASGDSNLEVLCFEINAEGNIKYPLAGRRNIFKVMEREAKELAFNTKGEDVDRIFRKQDQEYFLQGPKWQQQHEGRAYE